MRTSRPSHVCRRSRRLALPAIVEASDGRLWVVKFPRRRGGALVAEWICGELAARVRLRGAGLARGPRRGLRAHEPDPGSATCLARATAPTSGSRSCQARSRDPIAPPEWTKRSPRSGVVRRDDAQRRPLPAQSQPPAGRRPLLLIDHGAALYFHHSWATAGKRAEPVRAGARPRCCCRAFARRNGGACARSSRRWTMPHCSRRRRQVARGGGRAR